MSISSACLLCLRSLSSPLTSSETPHSRGSLLTLSINFQLGLLVTTMKRKLKYYCSGLKCECANNCNRDYCTPINIYLFKVNNRNTRNITSLTSFWFCWHVTSLEERYGVNCNKTVK